MNPRNINRHQSLARRVNEQERRGSERRNTRGSKRCLHLRNTDGSFYHCREIWCSLNAPIVDYANDNSHGADRNLSAINRDLLSDVSE